MKSALALVATLAVLLWAGWQRIKPRTTYGMKIGWDRYR